MCLRFMSTLDLHIPGLFLIILLVAIITLLQDSLFAVVHGVFTLLLTMMIVSTLLMLAVYCVYQMHESDV